MLTLPENQAGVSAVGVLTGTESGTGRKEKPRTHKTARKFRQSCAQLLALPITLELHRISQGH